MKDFIKFTFASMLGFFLSFILISIIAFFFLFLIIASFTSDSTRITEVYPNSVLEIKLNYEIPERTIITPKPDRPFPFIGFYESLGLNDILRSIKNAKTDENIEGIYLDLNNIAFSGYATLEPIRRALLNFKESGKFIIAHGDYILHKGYYLGTAADNIYLTPTGYLDFKGLRAELMFFKKTLDKLEIDPQVFYYGKYKSAVEPFKLDKMSEENREQTSALLSSMYEHIISEISIARNIPQKEILNIADNLLVRNPDDAYQLNLIDSLYYKDQLKDELKYLSGVDPNKRLKLINLFDYSKIRKSEQPSTRNRIAVVYAVGEIETGTGDDETIGTENIIEAIRKARFNNRVKAIVMRVNSPGGAVLTSDMIWREVSLAAGEKPFIVSMGNVAASGGYYISCPADIIVAEPNTITGSIGAYGYLPNMKDFFENTLGITFDRVNTGKYSDFGTTTRPFSPEEKKIVQKEIDKVYEDFIEKVADGRNMTKDKIDEIAQGRVYTGLQAKELGLIDEIGGLDDAIIIAANMANLDNYRIVGYPSLKSPFNLIQQLLFEQAELSYLKLKLGENFKYYKLLEKVINLQGMQARMPFEFEIN